MNIARGLGFWETYHQLALEDSGNARNLLLHIQVKKELDENLLRQALSFTFDKHPLLQATIIKKDDSYFFSQNATFDNIPIHYHQTEEAGLSQQLIHENLNRQFDEKKFLWRFDAVVSNQKTHLILTMHHAISDSPSLLIFMLDTLDHYYLILHDQAYKTPPKARPLFPPVEQLLERTIPTLDKHLIDGKQKKQHTKICLAPVLTIDKQQLICLKAYAKQQKITLNSLIAGAWIKTFLLMEKLEHTNFIFSSFTNLRKSCQEIGSQDIGLYEAITWKNVQTNPDKRIKDLAKEFEQSENMHPQDLFNLQKNMIEITNFGKVTIPSLLNKYFHVSNIIWSTSPTGSNILLGISEYQKNLHLYLNYREPMISSENANQFSSTLQHLINHL